MMSEKRFIKKVNNKGRLIIIDKECHTELFDLTLVCDVLNRLDLKLKYYNEVNGEQQSTITALKEENEQLRTQLIICQQSKNDDDRFKVWQVPPLKKGMRITTNLEHQTWTGGKR